MIATAIPGRFPHHFGRATEFATPPDNGAVEQTAFGEILQQGGITFIHIRQLPAHDLEVFLVGVPAGIIDGDIRNAAFNQPPCDEAGLAEFGTAIAITHLGFFLREVEHFRAITENHVVSHVLGLGGRNDLRVGGQILRERVQLMQQFTPLVLVLRGDTRSDDALHGERRLRGVAASCKGPKPRTQKAGFIETALGFGENDVGRNQPFVTGIVASEQGRHGASAGINHAAAGLPPSLHHVGGGLVSVVAMGHAADDGIFVRLLGDERQEFQNARAGHDGLNGLERARVFRARVGLGIKGVKMRRPAPHPDLDDRLGTRVGGHGIGVKREVFGERQAAGRKQHAAHGFATAYPGP